MARPRFEEVNPQLAIWACEMAIQDGIQPAAAKLGISKNTLKGLLKRKNMIWTARNAARTRKVERYWAGYGMRWK